MVSGILYISCGGIENTKASALRFKPSLADRNSPTSTDLFKHVFRSADNTPLTSTKIPLASPRPS